MCCFFISWNLFFCSLLNTCSNALDQVNIVAFVGFSCCLSVMFLISDCYNVMQDHYIVCLARIVFCICFWCDGCFLPSCLRHKCWGLTCTSTLWKWTILCLQCGILTSVDQHTCRSKWDLLQYDVDGWACRALFIHCEAECSLICD